MSNNEVRELCGRKFSVVEEGLDEGEIAEFLGELIQQRDTLLEQINSLLSYIRLHKLMSGKKDKLTDNSEPQAGNLATKTVTEAKKDAQPVMETAEPEQATQPVPPEASKAINIGEEEESPLYQKEHAVNWPVGTATGTDQNIHPAAETAEPEQVTQPVPPEANKAINAGEEEEPPLYQGELELAILPPVDATGLLQFERKLRDSFQLQILRTAGSPSKGSLITVLLSKPQPLLKGLKQIPEVKDATEELDTSAQAEGTPSSLFNSKQGKKIWVTLNAQAN